MKRVLSLMLALSMMLMVAGNVFAADYGTPHLNDSGKDIALTLVMGEAEETITVPAAKSYKDSDSGNVVGKNWFFASGKAVLKGIDEVVPGNDYADYANAVWYTDADFTSEVSFTDTDRFFEDMTLYAKAEKAPAPTPGAKPEVSDDVKSEGIAPEDIVNTLPADKTLKLEIAAVPSKTAESVVQDIADSDATIQPVAGSQPLYLDIKLLDAQGNAVQPGQAASITLPIPSKLQTALSGGVANAVLVIHYSDDGSVKEKMFATLSDAGLTFTVSSFSTFAFIAVEKTSFDVTIENVKGGILSVTDANGVMLPVGQKATVPAKEKESGNANELWVTFVPLMDAEESDLLVNGVSIGGAPEDFVTIPLSSDVVLTGVFASAQGGGVSTERYYAYLKPSVYSSNTNFSGTLKFKHQVNRQDTELTNATFAFDDNAAFTNDNAFFEISGNTLTSKAALSKPSYTVALKVTVDGKVYTHNTSATPRVQCRVTINSDAHFYVSFSRYLADQFDAWDGGWIGNVNSVPKDTAFAPLAVDQRNFYDITLKDGKPQMYGYEFDRWQQYKVSDDFETLIPVNTATVTSDLEVMAMFKNYRVNVQPLGGGGGGGGSSGGSGGGGGGSKSSLLGSGFTAGIAQPVSATQAKSAANKAIAIAKASGSTQATVKFKNAASISPAVMKQIADAAKKAGMTAMIQADTVVGGKVVARMYIDPAKMTLTGNFALGVTIGDKATEARFAKQYSNSIATLKLAQTGSFGASVRIAAKLDLGKLNAKTLVFYSFNPKTGKVVRLEDTAYAINQDGYIFFYTQAADTIVITDKPLAKK